MDTKAYGDSKNTSFNSSKETASTSILENDDPSIYLDYNESNSRTTEKIKICPRACQYITATNGEKIATFLMKCKRIDCPVCGPKKMKYYMKKYGQAAFNAFEYWKQIYPDRRDMNFWIKLLTFTLPGAEYRMEGFGTEGDQSRYYGNHTPSESYKEMQSFFNKLLTTIRKLYPKEEYIRVSEPHGDGYPHFHVLVIGPDVNKKGFLEDLRRLWVDKYGMGTQLNITAIKYGARAGVKYVMKYLTKLTRGIEFLPPKCRLVTESKGIRVWFKKKISTWVVTEIGSWHPSGGHSKPSDGYLEPFWKIKNDYLIKIKVDKNKNFKECMNYFESKIPKLKQLKLFLGFDPTFIRNYGDYAVFGR